MRIKKQLLGFTLLEVLLAMAVFALVGLASQLIFSQMTSSAAVTSARQAELQAIQRTWLLIESDIRLLVARPVRYLPEEARDIYILNDGGLLDSDYDGLGFVRGGWSNPQMLLPRSTLQPVIYRVQEQQLERLTTAYVDDVSGLPSIQPLLAEVTDFRVRYFHQGETMDTWGRSGELPTLVGVLIEHETYGSMERWFNTAGTIVAREEPAT